MEVLNGGYTLALCPGAFPLSTDSIALADFVRLPKSARVLDLGSGCGTLGLLLCAKDPGCTVTGIEIDEAAHCTAGGNAVRNGLENRLTGICADLRRTPELVAPGSFTTCVSNPPYFSGGPRSKLAPNARREDICSLDELIPCAAWALRFGGDFFLVHRPERLAQICALASRNQLEPKRLCLLRHKAGSPISLILMQCRKGAKPGLITGEASLYEADGSPTEYYRRLYHT